MRGDTVVHYPKEDGTALCGNKKAQSISRRSFHWGSPGSTLCQRCLASLDRKNQKKA